MSTDYEIARKETLDTQSSNAEAHDRAILTLSSAFLALSVSFLHDGFKDHPPTFSCFLYLSWFLFTAAIIITVFSYSYSQRTVDYKLSTLQTFFKEPKEQAKINGEITRMRTNEGRMNDFASGAFIFAVVFTVLFVTINAIGEENMLQKNGVQGHDVGKTAPSAPFPSQPTRPAPIPVTAPSPGRTNPSVPIQPAPPPLKKS